MLRKVPDRDEFSWQSPVIDKDLSAPPESPVKGDRYIVGPSARGNWIGHENDIAEYSGSIWKFYTAYKGWFVYVKDEDTPYHFDGAIWRFFYGRESHQGLQAIGTTISPTTSSTAWVDLPEMSINIDTGANPVLIIFSGEFTTTSANKKVFIRVTIDGAAKNESVRATVSSATDRSNTLAMSWLEILASGLHTIKMQWKVDSGTGVAVDIHRAMQVVELKN